MFPLSRFFRRPTAWISVLLIHLLAVAFAQEVVDDLAPGGGETAAEVEEALPEPEARDAIEVSDARNLMYEGMVDVQDENYEEAIPKLERVIEQDPTLLGAWETLGWAYWLDGREDRAVELWNQLVEIAPNEPVGYNLLAQVATRRGELRRAEELYRRSLSLNGDQFEIRANLARVLMWSGQRDEAVERLRTLLDADPERTDIEIDLAWALYGNEQYEESLEHWNDVLEIIPGHAGFLLARANVHMLMGMLEEAEMDARAALEVEPDNLAALNLLIALSMKAREPELTLRRLNDLLDQSDGLQNRIRVAQQIAVYINSVHTESPDIFTREDVIRAGRDAWELDRDNVESALFYGESLIMGKQYARAAEVFTHVLENLNPNNERAKYGMFESYMGRSMLDEAEAQLEENLLFFNPENPFRHVFWARVHNARGEFPLALKALERLEREGARGAVFSLLYHGISPSEFSDMPSVRQLREQVMALKRDGFRFITPSGLPAYFESRPEPPAVSEDDRPWLNRVVEGVKYSWTGDKDAEPETLSDYTPDKVAMVTFDDGLRNSFRYGNMVAAEVGATFTMFVGVGDVLSPEQRYIAQFPEIREYHESGNWEIQSHLWDAGQLAPVNEEGDLGLRLPNRLWLENKDRLETLKEYQDRLRHEFAASRRVLARELGVPEEEISSVAYPYGEIGQENITNIDLFDVTNVVLNEAEIFYERGFIQYQFGYSVKGDNPLLFKRYEPYRHASGRHVLRQAYLQHPVFVARRMRAEMAALNGKYDMAMENVELLRRDGYPEEDLRDLTRYVEQYLARLVRLPDPVEDTAGGDTGERAREPLIRLQNPLIGINGRSTRANEVIQEEEIGVFAGVNLNRRLGLQVRASTGEIEQTLNTETNRVIEVFESFQGSRTVGGATVVDGQVVPGRRTRTVTETVSFQSNRVDEITFEADFERVGGSLSYIHDSGAFTLGRLGLYKLHLPGNRSGSDQAFEYGVEHQWRPFPNLDFSAVYNHGVVPSARELIEYDQLVFRPIWRVRDGWQATGVGAFSFYEDDNSYLSLYVENLWNISDRLGVWFGVHNSVDTTDEDTDLYWTPFWEQRHYLILQLRRNYPNLSASIRAHLGLQKSEPRDEDIQEFLNLQVTAREQGGFAAGQGPDDGWNPLVGIEASIVRIWDNGFEVNAGFTVNSTDAYIEHTVEGSMLYRF